jgi:hypothetical protein
MPGVCQSIKSSNFGVSKVGSRWMGHVNRVRGGDTDLDMRGASTSTAPRSLRARTCSSRIRAGEFVGALEVIDDHIRKHHNIRSSPHCGCYRARLTLPQHHGHLEEAQMTFQSISGLTNRGELATSGMFACSFAALPVAGLPSDSLLPLVIENRSDRGFPQPKPHEVLSWSPERNAAGISGYPTGSVTVPHSAGEPIIPPVK